MVMSESLMALLIWKNENPLSLEKGKARQGFTDSTRH